MNDPEQPRRPLDPLALAVLGLAAAIGVGLTIWLVISIRSAPEPSQKATGADVRESIAEAAKKFLGRFAEGTKPAPPPSAAKGTKPVPAPATGKRGIDIAAGKTWTYAVRLEPEVWRDATLSYRTVAEQGAIVVHTEFRHAQGNLSFRLGNYAAGHASHAQIRFPGFFMHGAYLDFPLTPGKRFSWTYPWQMADNRVRADRVRRFDAVVGATETVSVPAGRFDAVRIDATLNYIDGGKPLATVNESIWFAPSIGQIVKVVRSGRSPDEAGQRIIADLAEVK